MIIYSCAFLKKLEANVRNHLDGLKHANKVDQLLMRSQGSTMLFSRQRGRPLATSFVLARNVFNLHMRFTSTLLSVATLAGTIGASKTNFVLYLMY